MALLMLGVFRGKTAARFVDGAAIALLVIAGAILLALPAGKLVSFGGSFVVDDFARFLKILALIGSAAAIAMSLDYARRERQQRFEYSVLILLSTLGMLMLISAADLIALYLGLELMSLPLYVMAASHRDSLRSTEAGLKYFVLGALSSGMLLYGASLVYGFTGTVSFAGIAQAAAAWRDRIDFRARLSLCRLLLQDLGGAVPHVDAGRLRRRADPGDGVFRRRAQGGGHRHVCARRGGGLPRHHDPMAANSSSSSPSPRWRSAPSPPSASATSSA